MNMESRAKVIRQAGRLRGVAFELDERFIIAVEQKLGAPLPYSYRRAMMTNNGGRVLASMTFGICIPS